MEQIELTLKANMELLKEANIKITKLWERIEELEKENEALRTSLNNR